MDYSKHVETLGASKMDGTKLPLTRAEYITVVVSLVIGFLLCFSLDFFFGNILLGSSRQLLPQEKPYLSKDHGWYELKPNFSGFDQFGPFLYVVETNVQGFRKRPNSSPPLVSDIIFLGDSFTYGVNGAWEDTYVGMFEKDTSLEVINAGVGSYSPSAYLYQYRKALTAGMLKNGHSVVVALDISDVQDEAGIWVDGELHPRKREEELVEGRATKHFPRWSDLKNLVNDNLPLTTITLKYVRTLLANQVTPVHSLPRSAFTHANWDDLNSKNAYSPALEGYAPLGVAGGLTKIEEKLKRIVVEGHSYNAKVYILIYPWPAQLTHNDKFSWSEYVANMCQNISCSGVIDTIPIFRAIALKQADW